MARPTKEGLDYFPLDVGIFEDEKIEAIAGEFGIKGELTVIKLLCAVYKKGYFVVWNDLTKATLLKRLPGVSKELLEQIVIRLVTWGFFDEDLFNSAKVLTSKNIQATYFEAIKRRKSPKPTKYVINVDNNSQAVEVNADINPQSKVKETKVNKSNNNNDSPLCFANEQWGKNRPLNGILQDAIMQWCSIWPNEMILYALELAYQNSVDMKGVKAYVNVILSNWENKSIDTLDKAKADTKKPKAKHKQFNSNRRVERVPDYINPVDPEKAAREKAQENLREMGIIE